jgi:diaminopimelate decarboxylase
MGTPFSWEYNEELAPEQRKWTGFETSHKTQYINFSFNNNQAPSEIIVYGYKVEDVVEEIPERKEHKKKSLEHFVGMNAFINDGNFKAEAFEAKIREYAKKFENKGHKVNITMVLS